MQRALPILCLLALGAGRAQIAWCYQSRRRP
jgi:hypothetical protein